MNRKIYYDDKKNITTINETQLNNEWIEFISKEENRLLIENEILEELLKNVRFTELKFYKYNNEMWPNVYGTLKNSENNFSLNLFRVNSPSRGIMWQVFCTSGIFREKLNKSFLSFKNSDSMFALLETFDWDKYTK